MGSSGCRHAETVCPTHRRSCPTCWSMRRPTHRHSSPHLLEQAAPHLQAQLAPTAGTCGAPPAGTACPNCWNMRPPIHRHSLPQLLGPKVPHLQAQLVQGAAHQLGQLQLSQGLAAHAAVAVVGEALLAAPRTSAPLLLTGSRYPGGLEGRDRGVWVKALFFQPACSWQGTRCLGGQACR